MPRIEATRSYVHLSFDFKRQKRNQKLIAQAYRTFSVCGDESTIMHFVKSVTKKIILIEWGIDIFQLGKNKKRNAGNGLAKLVIKLWTIAHNVRRVAAVRDSFPGF